MRFKIKELIWDVWNIKHIEKHGVSLKEVEEAVGSKIKTLKGYREHYLILGVTKKGRLLTVVLALKKGKSYFVVTARDMSKKERRYYYDEKNT